MIEHLHPATTIPHAPDRIGRVRPAVRDRHASTYRGAVLAYLSDEWIRALDHALQNDAVFEAATRHAELTVQNVVTGTDAGTVAYTVSLDHGTNHVTAGAHGEADVSFICDIDTARAIAVGSESAQAAFMAGRLRIGGDARRLMENQSVLAGLDDVFGAVRADTDFGDEGTSPAGGVGTRQARA